MASKMPDPFVFVSRFLCSTLAIPAAFKICVLRVHPRLLKVFFLLHVFTKKSTEVNDTWSYLKIQTRMSTKTKVWLTRAL